MRKFQVKFLATKKFVLATKSKNLGASWPQGFFSKVEPCYTWYNSVFLVVGLTKEELKFYIDSLKKEQGEQGLVGVGHETLDAETAFYWRCLGEHFKSIAIDGEALLDELLPDISGFCKYIQG